jgi:hypothetical protein
LRLHRRDVDTYQLTGQYLRRQLLDIFQMPPEPKQNNAEHNDGTLPKKKT